MEALSGYTPNIYIYILCICYVVNSSPNITHVVTPSLNINTQYIHINKSIFIYIYVIFIHMSRPLRYVIHNNIKPCVNLIKLIYIVVLMNVNVKIFTTEINFGILIEMSAIEKR